MLDALRGGHKSCTWHHDISNAPARVDRLQSVKNPTILRTNERPLKHRWLFKLLFTGRTLLAPTWYVFNLGKHVAPWTSGWRLRLDPGSALEWTLDARPSPFRQDLFETLFVAERLLP